MEQIRLGKDEMDALYPGELTMATVTVVFTVVILAIVAFKIFTAKGSTITLPGGYKFEFTSAKQ